MKAVIPVAGVGTRLRPHTHTQPKALVPVAGKPILLHIVDQLIGHNIKEFVFIVGYLGEKIKKTILQQYEGQELSIEFVVQEPRKGIGHALYLAREHYRKEKEMLIVLGDTIVTLDMNTILAQEQTVLGVHKVNNPRQFGIAELQPGGKIRRLVEKPTIPKSNQALVGFYKIADPELLVEGLDHILKNKIKTLGEYHLTDALTYMLEKGHPMVAQQVETWFDCGKRSSLLEANAILLGQQQDNYQRLQEQYPNCIFIPPVSIGENCSLINSIIGPNVAIGDDTVVTYSIIEDTIVGAYTELRQVVLEHSIIGNDTRLQGLSQRLNIGDNTEINFAG